MQKEHEVNEMECLFTKSQRRFMLHRYNKFTEGFASAPTRNNQAIYLCFIVHKGCSRHIMQCNLLACQNNVIKCFNLRECYVYRIGQEVIHHITYKYNIVYFRRTHLYFTRHQIKVPTYMYIILSYFKQKFCFQFRNMQSGLGK